MQIVIEINENMYQKIKDMENLILKNRMFKSLELAVLEGKVLPEHHRELIERDKVLKSLVDYVDGKKSLGQCIDDVPTIIEATEAKMNGK